jgi:hypothetical protein
MTSETNPLQNDFGPFTQVVLDTLREIDEIAFGTRTNPNIRTVALDALSKGQTTAPDTMASSSEPQKTNTDTLRNLNGVYGNNAASPASSTIVAPVHTYSAPKIQATAELISLDSTPTQEILYKQRVVCAKGTFDVEVPGPDSLDADGQQKLIGLFVSEILEKTSFATIVGDKLTFTITENSWTAVKAMTEEERRSGSTPISHTKTYTSADSSEFNQLILFITGKTSPGPLSLSGNARTIQNHFSTANNTPLDSSTSRLSSAGRQINRTSDSLATEFDENWDPYKPRFGENRNHAQLSTINSDKDSVDSDPNFATMSQLYPNNFQELSTNGSSSDGDIENSDTDSSVHSNDALLAAMRSENERNITSDPIYACADSQNRANQATSKSRPIFKKTAPKISEIDA